MTNQSTNNTIHDKILGAIHSGEMKMRPRWHFVLRNVLFGFGTLIILMLVLYAISFIVFVLHQNGTWFLPAFGLETLGLFLFSLPWLLIMVTLFFVLVLEILVQQYSFSYRRPLMLSAFGVIVIVIAGGFVVAMTPLHPHFFRIEHEGGLPIAGGLYEGFGGERFRDIHPCMLIATTSDGFSARDIRGMPLRVVIMEGTRFPLGTDFTVGDRVLVIGREDDGVIRANGVRKIDVK